MLAGLGCIATQTAHAAGAKSPRGYCTHITRALAPTSRCYTHLKSIDQDDAEREQLVYVRLETLGASLDVLHTRAINERLLVGVLERLLGADGNASVAHKRQVNQATDPQTAQVRAQILDKNTRGDMQENACRSAIERLVCRLVYPSCHFRRADVAALVRPPCRDDCLVARDVLCATLNWTQFVLALQRAFNATLMSTINALDLESQGERFAQQQQQQQSDKQSSVHFYWPHERALARCERLPQLYSDADSDADAQDESNQSQIDVAHRLVAIVGARVGAQDSSSSNATANKRRWWPICSNARLTETRFGGERQARECLQTRNGAEYIGAKNITASGRACQPWARQWPHGHSSSELLFDTTRRAHNHCRNVGGVERAPWCYTVDRDTRWEYCDIPACQQ